MTDVLPNITNVQIATDEAFSTLLINDTLTYQNSRVFSTMELPYAVNLYARVRHGHPNTGISNWSPTKVFQVALPTAVIGVCLDNSSTKGVFYWIDAIGNKLDTFDQTKHPTFAAIVMATIDDARAPVTMTRIPLFYVKTAASGPVGSFAAGKKCWWISDLMNTGFRPAACFKRTTQKDAGGKYTISPYCYIGSHIGHQETIGGTVVLGSSKGKTVAASQTKATFAAWIANRNNASAGMTGFRMFDIWDLSAIRLLLLIAKGSSNSQASWGDNSTPVISPKTGSTNARAVFKGTQAAPTVSIEDLWRCYWYHTDLIAVTASGVVSLKSPMDRLTTLSFGAENIARYTQPTTAGWLRDVLDCPTVIGDDTHDLMELFLPKTVTSAESQATFSDKYFFNGGDFLAGGAFGYDETYQNYEQTGSASHSPLGDAGGDVRGCQYAELGGDYAFCSYLGHTCPCSSAGGGCPVTIYTPVYGYVTRTRTVKFTTEPGIFSEMIGIPTPASNAAMVTARISKN